MASPQPDSSAEFAARLSDLESRYTLLQRTVEELDQVVVRQAKEMDVLQHKFVRLAGQLSTLAERTPEERGLEDEKPPHY